MIWLGDEKRVEHWIGTDDRRVDVRVLEDECGNQFVEVLHGFLEELLECANYTKV